MLREIKRIGEGIERLRDCPSRGSSSRNEQAPRILVPFAIRPINLLPNKSRQGLPMALMTWTSKYSVGVEDLDRQHKALMEALNELHAASMQGRSQGVADSLLRRIASIAREHFSAEEKLMESAGFSGLASHRAKHQELASRVREFVTRHEKGDAAVYTQLLYFMRDWQTKHMQTEDQEYAQWLRADGRNSRT